MLVLLVCENNLGWIFGIVIAIVFVLFPSDKDANLRQLQPEMLEYIGDCLQAQGATAKQMTTEKVRWHDELNHFLKVLRDELQHETDSSTTRMMGFAHARQQVQQHFCGSVGDLRWHHHNAYRRLNLSL